MQVSSASKKDSRGMSGGERHDRTTFLDLKTISDLGRSLLLTVHPKKVATRVAAAVQSGVDADVCAFIVELNNIGIVNCAFDCRGQIAGGALNRSHFEKWLDFMPPQVGYLEENTKQFLVEGQHCIEYVSPLRIDGEIKGAIVTGFTRKQDFIDSKAHLIDAATQMAAMSVNLSAHFETALNDSINQAKEENRKFTEAVLDSLPVSLYVVDRDYRIVTWNRHREVGVQGIPRDTAIGRDVFTVLAKFPEGRLRQEFERVFRTGQLERIEQQTIADDGSTRHWVVSKVPMKDALTGKVTHVITIGEDVTVRVEAIHAIGRAEKLAAVGRLAAGVVHEINNPLATIAACAEALEQRVEEGSFTESEAAADLNEYLALIKSEAFRCKSITTGLLDFSRVRTGERTQIDLGEILKSSARLISHQRRGGSIQIGEEIDEPLPSLRADGGQIQQAVIALATNAIDAMPDGGTLSFRAYSRANSVIIEIEDTGVGIESEHLPKVFEPFFTTKEVGRGTGLGLAVCYGIITDHGGRLSVRSTVGKGSVFSILLPVNI
jgi:two-component system, NtrC family, sensor kinase